MTGLPVGTASLRAIVFDLDGTLYQDDRMGEEIHRSACRYVATLKGLSAAEAGTLLLSHSGASGGTLSQAVMALGGELRELHRRFTLEVHPEAALSPDPRVQELLWALARRFKLHIYTNNNRALSARIMAQIGVAGSFQKVFTIEDSWCPKPHRETLLGILDAIDSKPGETLFVGDRYQVDLELPAALGCPVLETGSVEELLELRHLVE